MAGISAIESKLKTLDKKTEEVTDKNYTSVVWLDNEDNWYVPEGKIPRPTGVLVVPLPLTVEEWESGHGKKPKSSYSFSFGVLKQLDPEY